MMRLLLPAILAFAGLGGGVGAAYVLRPGPEPVGEVDAAAGPCGADGTDVAMDAHGAGDATVPAAAQGADRRAAATGDSEYTEMGDQFVVPVVEDGSVTALVVLTLSVETAPGFGAEIQAHAPKLRDVFLRDLLDHANVGGFRGMFTANGTMDRLRTALRETGQKTMGKKLRDVLIVEINRQELT